jgi:hypothetical protein
MCLFVRFHGNYLIFCIFCRATVCCPLLCLCRPFCSFERCLDWTQRAAGNYREDETAKFPAQNLQLCEIQVQQSQAINQSNSFFWRLCPDSWSVRAPGPRRSARTFTPATAAPRSPGGRGCVEKRSFLWAEILRDGDIYYFRSCTLILLRTSGPDVFLWSNPDPDWFQTEVSDLDPDQMVRVNKTSFTPPYQSLNSGWVLSLGPVNFWASRILTSTSKKIWKTFISTVL